MAQSADFSTLKEFVETVFVEAAQEDTQDHVEISGSRSTADSDPNACMIIILSVESVKT